MRERPGMRAGFETRQLNEEKKFRDDPRRGGLENAEKMQRLKDGRGCPNDQHRLCTSLILKESRRQEHNPVRRWKGGLLQNLWS